MSGAPKTIEEMFQGFANDTMRKRGVSETSIEWASTRRAFFCGAITLLGMIHDCIEHHGAEGAGSLFVSLHHETHEFMHEMQQLAILERVPKENPN